MPQALQRKTAEPDAVAPAIDAPRPAAPLATVALIRREEVARDTMAFHFTRPPGFAFEPGQAIDLTLIDPPLADAKGATRAFSIVSAPGEDELVVATRLRDSAFKRVLRALPAGARLRLDGPFGSLALHPSRSRMAVFFAGGIGVTPFMSILRQAFHDRLPQVFTLVTLNRRAEDAPFLPELRRLQQLHPGNFELIPLLTGGGGRGAPPIDPAFVRRLVVPPTLPLFYVAGPPGMVAFLRGVLARAGVGEAHVRSEDFPGY